MARKLIQKIDTVHGWNTISVLSGITSVGCFVVYIVLTLR
jgi:hypothetical protein